MPFIINLENKILVKENNKEIKSKYYNFVNKKDFFIVKKKGAVRYPSIFRITPLFRRPQI